MSLHFVFLLHGLLLACVCVSGEYVDVFICLVCMFFCICVDVCFVFLLLLFKHSVPALLQFKGLHLSALTFTLCAVCSGVGHN